MFKAHHDFFEKMHQTADGGLHPPMVLLINLLPNSCSTPGNHSQHIRVSKQWLKMTALENQTSTVAAVHFPQYCVHFHQYCVFIYKQAALEAEDEVQRATEPLAQEVHTWGDILQDAAYIADTTKGKENSKKKATSLCPIWNCLLSTQLPLNLAQVSITPVMGKILARKKSCFQSTSRHSKTQLKALLGSINHVERIGFGPVYMA